MNWGDFTVSAWVMLACVVAVYLLPTIVAVWRGHRVIAVFMVNLFAGWTLVGWFGSMVMAIW